MLARLRVAARVLAAALIPLTLAGFVAIAGLDNPGEPARSSRLSDDERDLDLELQRCDAVDQAGSLVRLLASEPLEKARAACAGLRTSSGDARTRMERFSAEGSRRLHALRSAVDNLRIVLAAWGATLILGAGLATAGLGRVAAGTLLSFFVLAFANGVLPLAIAASVPPALLFLACAAWTGPRTPSDRVAAHVLSVVLVPLTSAWMVGIAYNIGSGRSDVRLRAAVALLAIGWTSTGIPLATLIRRASSADPAAGLLVARGALALFGLATAVAMFLALAG